MAGMKQTYHHGDLRAAAIGAGLELLRGEAGSVPALREVARAVGVTPTAIYRHFPDKDAFLTALATEGFAQLAHAQLAAQRRGGDGLAGFRASGRAYVDFALAQPALFRLMFTHAPPNAATPPAEADDAMALLRRNVTAIAGEGVSAATITALCVHAWALVHGLSVLLLDGQLPRDDRLIDAAIDPVLLIPAATRTMP